MLKKMLFSSALLVAVITFSGCGKDDPVIPEEVELITSLIYTLTPADGGSPVVLSFVDLDGDGGNDPVITGATLVANQSYTGSIELLNESETPVESITEEIEEEQEEHQFFFQSTIADLAITYSDQDANGNPVGLSSTVTTGEAASGSITITLRHEPSKDASGVSDGDLANAGGETDIEVTIPVAIQ
ncbi:hypothetical protein N8482_01420 [Chitinophagales bacterium]|nr:hypothetical protein [Chitinophagales bacterium]